MLQDAIFSTFIKLSFVIKIFVLSIFEWPFYVGFTSCVVNYYSSGLTSLKKEIKCETLSSMLSLFTTSLIKSGTVLLSRDTFILFPLLS